MYQRERPEYMPALSKWHQAGRGRYGRSGNPIYSGSASGFDSPYRVPLSAGGNGYVSHRMENPFSKQAIKGLCCGD
ncbi:MAG: hypothetical protein HY518_00565 [Candidatus Aenigmarchaeota archaeon]|nr:hypothetical protein [Candidatus Aenigmarchaeota archaeon]